MINEKERKELEQLIKEFKEKVDNHTVEYKESDTLVMLTRMIVNLNERLDNIEKKL